MLTHFSRRPIDLSQLRTECPQPRGHCAHDGGVRIWPGVGPAGRTRDRSFPDWRWALVVLPLGFKGSWDRGQRRERASWFSCSLIITLLQSWVWEPMHTAEASWEGKACRQGKTPGAMCSDVRERRCPENDGAQRKATPRVRGTFPVTQVHGNLGAHEAPPTCHAPIQ